MICKTASVTLAILTLACSAPPPKDAPPSTPPASPTPTPDPDRKLPEPLPSIAARVNGQPIPMAGVHKLAKKGTSTHGKVPLAYRQAVQELVDRELLFQEALDRRLSADDAAIQKAYDEAKDEQTKKLYGDMLASYAKSRQEMTTKVEEDPALTYNRQLLSKHENALNAYAHELAKFEDKEGDVQKGMEEMQKKLEEAKKQ